MLPFFQIRAKAAERAKKAKEQETAAAAAKEAAERAAALEADLELRERELERRERELERKELQAQLGYQVTQQPFYSWSGSSDMPVKKKRIKQKRPANHKGKKETTSKAKGPPKKRARPTKEKATKEKPAKEKPLTKKPTKEKPATKKPSSTSTTAVPRKPPPPVVPPPVGQPTAAAAAPSPVPPPVAVPNIPAAAQKDPMTPVHIQQALGVPLTSRQSECWKAVALVKAELLSHVWPTSAQQVYAIAAAMEHFMREIFLPHLFTTVDCPRSTRPFLAALLVLRELMSQNANTFFPCSDHELVEGDEVDDLFTTQQGDTQHPGHARRRGQDTEEERAYHAKMYATAVIFSALGRLGEGAEAYTQELTGLIEKYDQGHDEFSSCLPPADGRVQGVLPNAQGQPMEVHENVAWKVSYNQARKEHPLIVQKEQDTQESQAHQRGVAVPRRVKRIQVPQPNACYVAMVENHHSRVQAHAVNAATPP